MRKVLKVLGVVLLLAAGYAGIRFGPTIWDLARGGFFDRQEMRKYKGSSVENLKALYTALMLYHESEGQFPDAAGWMDAIKDRLKTADLTEADAMSKFRDPALGGRGGYGFGMNDAASRKYRGDIKEPSKTPLLFSSSDVRWNAHGDPKKLQPTPARKDGNLAISVDGTLIQQPR